MDLGHIFQEHYPAIKRRAGYSLFSECVHSGLSWLPSSSSFQLYLSSALPFLQLISLLTITLPMSFALACRRQKGVL